MEQMRVFRIDGDELAVRFRLHEKTGHYLGTYPDFLTEPRHTPAGRPWVNVTIDSCPYAPQPDGDCGGCMHLKKEDPGDLIGVCFHEANQLEEVEHDDR